MNKLSQNPPLADDALRASQERFRLIFDSLPAAMRDFMTLSGAFAT